MIWDATDRLQLRDYLNATTSGHRLVQAMRDNAPKMDGTSIEARAISASEFKGFMSAVDLLRSLSLPTNDQAPDHPNWVADKPPKDFDPEKLLGDEST